MELFIYISSVRNKYYFYRKNIWIQLLLKKQKPDNILTHDE